MMGEGSREKQDGRKARWKTLYGGPQGGVFELMQTVLIDPELDALAQGSWTFKGR